MSIGAAVHDVDVAAADLAFRRSELQALAQELEAREARLIGNPCTLHQAERNRTATELELVRLKVAAQERAVEEARRAAAQVEYDHLHDLFIAEREGAAQDQAAMMEAAKALEKAVQAFMGTPSDLQAAAEGSDWTERGWPGVGAGGGRGEVGCEVRAA
jgi:hypothetical protein